MRPLPIHMTFNDGDRRYAVRCSSIEQARQLRDRTLYCPRMKYTRINKTYRLHRDTIFISVNTFVKRY